MPASVHPRQAIDLFLNLLFPPHCIGCNKVGDLLCAECLATMPHLSPPLCELCGAPQHINDLCHLRQEASPHLERIRSLFSMEGLAREAVYQLKYHNLKTLAPLLARLMADYATSGRMPVDVVVPVPLHKGRLRERGYNQAALLAKALSEEMATEYSEDSLERVKQTNPQATTRNAGERRQNVDGAFSCVGSEITEKRVLLVDDVCTTGATLNACASALKASGAKSVWAITLTRET